jgi:uncharacterized protein YecE (DUF72 family)
MIRIGTSGWSYPHWRGKFYPIGVPSRNELAYASSQFDTLEVNRSFYSLLRPSSCELWRETTPARFLFALKGGNFITHAKKLRGVETALANYFASGPLVLGAKLGPIVWQLPATLRYDRERLAAFFALLPRNGAEAAALALRHDERVRVEAPCRVSARQRLRHAIEPRHVSFRDPDFAQLAREHGVAIAVADSADWPCFEEITTDFMYVRLHGSERTYASGYDARAIRRWRDRIRAWCEGRYLAGAPRISERKPRRVRDVFVYFDNDLDAHAANDARALGAALSAAGRG